MSAEATRSLCLFLLLVCMSLTAQTPPQQPNTQVSESAAEQAIHVVVQHYVMSSLSVDPKAQQHTSPGGAWSFAKTVPAACQQTWDGCVEVFYTIPAKAARCSWTVLLNGDGADGTVLDENSDAATYMMRRVSQTEARPLVQSRKRPSYPPIAIMAHISGEVLITDLIDQSGTIQKTAVVSGPAMLQQAAINAASQWKFKPLMIGTRAIPYELQLAFTFRTAGPPFATVEMKP